MILIELFLQHSDALIYLFFVFGAILGSFANVIIYRWPREMNIAVPGSHCFQCEAPVRWFDNIPIFSWFVLRGKCRKCSAPFSFRYVVVELMMGGVFAALYFWVGPQWLLLEYLIFAFALVTACWIDVDHMLLPDVLTLSGIVIGLVGAALNPEREFLSAIYGVLMGGGFLWAIAYVYLVLRGEEGMGGGDIKLLAWIGAVLGWKSIPFVILGSSVAGSVIGIAYGLKTKAGLKSTLPFGPYLGLAALAFIFGGDKLAMWYLSLFIPSLSPVN